jgi:hypothetical protein
VRNRRLILRPIYGLSSFCLAPSTLAMTRKTRRQIGLRREVTEALEAPEVPGAQVNLVSRNKVINSNTVGSLIILKASITKAPHPANTRHKDNKGTHLNSSSSNISSSRDRHKELTRAKLLIQGAQVSLHRATKPLLCFDHDLTMRINGGGGHAFKYQSLFGHWNLVHPRGR